MRDNGSAARDGDMIYVGNVPDSGSGQRDW